MADFRKWLYAVAFGALAVGAAAPAFAQNCTQLQSVDPIVRQEGYTELAGDIIITCTGGTPTTATHAVPQVNITVFVNANITSKITATATAPTPNFSEALMLIDDPNTPFNNGPAASGGTTYTHPILACGTGNATFDNSNPGVCSVTATGVPATAYDGNNVTGAARPNVFQGRTVPGNVQAIQFLGVPIDPPGPGLIHTYRITNIRINANLASGAASNLLNAFTGLYQVSAIVTFNPTNSIVTSNSAVTIATIRSGFGGVTGSTVGPYPQCTPSGGYTQADSVTVAEGFATAFKVRNWALTNANGLYNGASDWIYNTALPAPVTAIPDLNQDVAGALYSTESGFMYPGANPGVLASPPQNPPNGISQIAGSALDQGNAASANVPFSNVTTGIGLAGSVSNGTRLAFTFSGIPLGSNATVPNAVALMNGAVQSGVMVAVVGADAQGNLGTLATVAGSQTLAEPTQTIIYEVVFADYVAVETATVPVTLHVVPNLGSTTVVNGIPQIVPAQATATAGFAPFYPGSYSVNPGVSQLLYPPNTGGLPIPRFVPSTNPSVKLWSFVKCACDLLFPWVVGDGTFTTSIVVANTSLDPGTAYGFTGAPQSGRVTFWYYGTNDTGHTGSAIDNTGANTTLTTTTPGYFQQTSNLIPPGSYAVAVVSTSASAAAMGTPIIPTALNDAGATGASATAQPTPTAFAGYVIAQSEFRYCHGVAAIHANTPGFGTQTYLGLVLDNGSALPARTNNLGEALKQ